MLFERIWSLEDGEERAAHFLRILYPISDSNIVKSEPLRLSKRKYAWKQKRTHDDWHDFHKNMIFLMHIGKNCTVKFFKSKYLKKSLTIQFSKSIFRCNIDYFLDQNYSTNGTLFVSLYVAFLIIAIFMNVMKERRVAWQVDAPLFFPDEQFTNQPVRYPQP